MSLPDPNALPFAQNGSNVPGWPAVAWALTAMNPDTTQSARRQRLNAKKGNAATAVIKILNSKLRRNRTERSNKRCKPHATVGAALPRQGNPKQRRVAAEPLLPVLAISFFLK